jgi:signal peptidase I
MPDVTPAAARDPEAHVLPAVLAVIVSPLLPGFGHAMLRRRGGALGWAAAAFATLALLPLWIGFVQVAIVIRLLCVADTIRVMRREAVIARVLGPLQAVVLVIAGVSFGCYRLLVHRYTIPTSSMAPTILENESILTERLSLRWRDLARADVIVFRFPCNPEIIEVKRVIALAGETIEVRCDVVFVNGKPLDTMLVANGIRVETDYRQIDDYLETVDGRSYHTGHTLHVTPGTPNVATKAHDFPRIDAPITTCNSSQFFDGTVRVPQATGKVVDTPGGAPCGPTRHLEVPAGSVFVLGDNRDDSIDSRSWGVVPTEAIVGRAIGVFGWLSSRSLR